MADWKGSSSSAKAGTTLGVQNALPTRGAAARRSEDSGKWWEAREGEKTLMAGCKLGRGRRDQALRPHSARRDSERER